VEGVFALYVDEWESLMLQYAQTAPEHILHQNIRKHIGMTATREHIFLLEI
jgi:hypothetical protein